MTDHQFTPEDVLSLLVERNGEFHDVLDAHVLVTTTATTAVVALVAPGAIGEPSDAQHFLVRVERAPLSARNPKEN